MITQLDRIYLDHNATSPVRPEVQAAITSALAEAGNPSSVHQPGRRARRRLDEAREAVAAEVRARPDEVVFTSGGTEANVWALLAAPGPKIISAIEHGSVLAAAPDACQAPVDGTGRLDLGAFAALIDEVRPALVSLMLANNETGVIQPVAEAAALARVAGAVVHCDAVQGLGKLDLDLAALGVDLLTLSAHKIGGPMGVGALVVRAGLEVEPMIRGGGQEHRRRAGTENLPGIVGFGGVCGCLAADPGARARIEALRDDLEAGILGIASGARIVGGSVARLPNTSCIVMPLVSNETQLIALDLAGIAVSTGSACSSGKVGPSHVLQAMGLPADQAGAAIRVSLGWSSTSADVDRLLEAWGALYRRTRREHSKAQPRTSPLLANPPATTT